MSSSFGSYDLAGLPKAASWWYRSWWLGNISKTDAGRPPMQQEFFIHLVESWRNSPTGKRTINVYTNGPHVRLLVNGVAVQGQAAMRVDKYGSALFRSIQFTPGNITAEAIASPDSDVPLASHTKYSWGEGAAIQLSLDAPSMSTGTGNSVYLDGTDVALLRASVVDANGILVQSSTTNISFTISAGPARIAAVANGDPADHTPAHASWKQAYNGFVRVITQTTLKATESDAVRALEALVNPDAGREGRSSSVAKSGHNAPSSFTVTASAQNLTGASLTVPLSTDVRDSVLSVAAASVGRADIGADER